MNEQQKGFYGGIDDLSRAGKFEIVAAKNDGMIEVGSYALKAIDVGDMEKEKDKIVTPQSMLSHELAEQKKAQVDGVKYDQGAHDAGIRAEKE